MIKLKFTPLVVFPALIIRTLLVKPGNTFILGKEVSS